MILNTETLYSLREEASAWLEWFGYRLVNFRTPSHFSLQVGYIIEQVFSHTNKSEA